MHALSYGAYGIARPFIIVGEKVGKTIRSHTFVFQTKNSLMKDNQNLTEQLRESNLKLADHQMLADENTALKAILGRKDDRVLVLAGILEKPNRSLYDTLIIDIGSDKDILVGNKVFASGDILIGEITDVYNRSAKVSPYSTPSEKHDAVISALGITGEAIGRGNGNFEITVPHDVIIEPGMAVVMPGVNQVLLGTVDQILSDPRDPFQKVLFRSPVNIQELSYIEVEVSI